MHTPPWMKMSHTYHDDDEDEDLLRRKFEADQFRENLILIGGLIFLLVTLTIISIGLTSCTISFQNISTHGQATDLVDENQTTDPVITPETSLTIPLKGL